MCVYTCARHRFFFRRRNTNGSFVRVAFASWLNLNFQPGGVYLYTMRETKQYIYRYLGAFIQLLVVASFSGNTPLSRAKQKLANTPRTDRDIILSLSLSEKSQSYLYGCVLYIYICVRTFSAEWGLSAGFEGRFEKKTLINMSSVFFFLFFFVEKKTHTQLSFNITGDVLGISSFYI